MKIAVIFDASGPMAVREDHLQQLSTACPDAEIRFSEDPAELIEAEFQADVLICWATGGKFSCGDYCRFDQQLKWIHCLSSGTEGLMRDPVSARPGLLVTCSKGIHGVPMANHVMGYMLAFLRRFPELAANQKKHTWVRPMPDEAYLYYWNGKYRAGDRPGRQDVRYVCHRHPPHADSCRVCG